MNLKWRLSQASGYIGLGMVREAAAELEQVPAAAARRPEVLALRALVLQEQEDWPELVEVAGRLVKIRPREAGWWIAWAYATRRSQSLVAAEAILLRAEQVHPHEPTVQFNLGCYACLRGDLDEARRRVDRAVALDESFHRMAATDPDLALLRQAEADSKASPPGPD